MNQTEIFALMRSDLRAVGIDSKKYVPQRITLPILTSYQGKYKELLERKFAQCSYSQELALRLLYYLVETSMRGGKYMGDILEQHIDYQAEFYGVKGEEFIGWLFWRENVDQFMLHLTKKHESD